MGIHQIIHLSKMTGAAGSEGHLLALLQGLRRHGLDARLWILIEPDTPVPAVIARAEAAGIPTEYITIHHDIDPGLWLRLARLFRAARPDVVHTHLLHADLYGIPAARLAGVPHVVCSRHNDDQFRRKLLMRWLHRWLWRRVDRGIAISEAIRQFAIQVEGALPHRVQTIHYGLDPVAVIAPPGARSELYDTLNLPPDALIVGSVCRLTEQKGLVYGLRGFAQAARCIPEAYYVIVGDGPQRHVLEAEAASLDLQGRVFFLGWRDNPLTIMAALDVLLAPSLWEGFGLVFLEAMALYVPIIGTRVSAIPEVVADGETGWLVPPADAEAIGAALVDALGHPEELRTRGANGRRRLEKIFTAETMITNTLTVYDSLEETR